MTERGPDSAIAAGSGVDARPAGGPAERVLEGLAVAPGIAAGPIFRIESGVLQVADRRITAAECDSQLERLEQALVAAARQIRKLKGKARQLPDAAAEELREMLEAHLHMLADSRLVRGARRRIVEERVNAEGAVQRELAQIMRGFASLSDAYIAARAEDVRVVGERLIRHLTGTPYHAFRNLPQGTIVLAEELTPADTALIDPARILGLAAVLGGAEGHTAVMARSLGLPTVLGAAGLTTAAASAKTAIVDGGAGLVILDPTPETLARYRGRRAEADVARQRLARMARLPAITRDGVEITLEANIELPREVPAAMEAGASGVGLVRTEFLYMNRPDLPDEDEQYGALSAIVDGMAGRPVTLRTFDIGGDKAAAPLLGDGEEAANPALGLRAIRLALSRPKLLETQLAAMLRAGARGPVRILLPMIASVAEVAMARRTLARVARRLMRRGVAIADPLPPLGVMIEVPGAALSADALAEVADFFAIGTNDLTMYTLAVDRGDERVAHLYNPVHPAVLRLIQFSVEAGRRAGLPVSICGEMAGDPRLSPLLVGLGVRELSMASSRLAPVKDRLRQLDTLTAAEHARAVMAERDEDRVARLIAGMAGGGA